MLDILIIGLIVSLVLGYLRFGRAKSAENVSEKSKSKHRKKWNDIKMRETQSQSRGPRFLHTHIFSCCLAAGEMVKLETKNSIPNIALIRAATTAKNVGSEEEE